MTQDSNIGKTLADRYTIKKLIGTGGMANVYLADDGMLGRPVAIKMLNPKYAGDESFSERLLREASAAAKLNHPNIVQVYDRGEADGTPYIVMEYVAGTTLKDAVRRRGALNPAEVFDAARQTLSALRFAHRNGVVHRDIKPHNLMVNQEGRIKVADFGIARAGTDTGLTEVGSIVGTAQYLSPEQAQGKAVGAPSDLYSLGVTMFELCTGEVPYGGENQVNVALRHVNDPVPRARDKHPNVPFELDAVIYRAMQKDLSDRYATAAQMLEDIEAALGGNTSAETTRIIAAAERNDKTTVMSSVSPMVPPPRTGSKGSSTAEAAAEHSIGNDPLDDAFAGKTSGKKKKKKTWPLALLVVAMFSAFAFGGLWVLSGSEAKQVQVPDLRGLTLEESRDALYDAGLKVERVDRKFSDQKPGVVILQDPPGGKRVESGTGVVIAVSKGREPIAAPDVVGKPQAEAVKIITDAGFAEPRIVKVFDEDAEEGTVVSQTPDAGTEADASTRFELSVSKGNEQKGVPSVIGLTADEAEATLTEAGLEFTTNTDDSAAPEGEVIAQAPPAGTDVNSGSTVTITLASGSNAVPSVIGKTAEEAKAMLEEAGFVAEITEVEDPTLDAGATPAATQQNPEPSTVTTVGTKVTVTISIPGATNVGEDPGEVVDGGAAGGGGETPPPG